MQTGTACYAPNPRPSVRNVATSVEERGKNSRVQRKGGGGAGALRQTSTLNRCSAVVSRYGALQKSGVRGRRCGVNAQRTRVAMLPRAAKKAAFKARVVAARV